MGKKLTLTKEQINGIKYFIRQEEKLHQFGSWDRIKITSLRIHANGDYSFKVNYMRTYAGKFDDYWEKGNLFNEYPIFSVFDGLDAVQMLFHRIHYKAYERCIEYVNKKIIDNNSNFDYLRELYKPGSWYNKENKIISDIRYE